MECMDFEPADGTEWDVECVCGHVQEEHGIGFFRSCTICTPEKEDDE